MNALRIAVAAIAFASAAGCASLQEIEGLPFSQPSAAEPGRQQLAEAVALYDAGDFHGTIRKLETSREIWTAPVPVRTAAYKQLAFAQCAVGRRTLCRRAFDNLLVLDPKFELSALEAGHPIWGPVFRQAQRDSPARAMGAAR
ncbi:MAG TPA: TssQ family T6SS-associated lipoprotein [Burkholderiaceae bacterium]|nr:TssQ family T6SS-associated lipoprotein [Burkholderiaceae bacterium]